MRIKTAFLAVTILLVMQVACGKAANNGSPAPSGAGEPSPLNTQPSPTDVLPTEAEPTGSEEFFIKDFDSASSWDNARQQIFEANGNVYYLCEDGSGDDIVYFSDFEGKDWMPLCGKAECMHNGPGCNARLEGTANLKMWLYGRHIYYVVSAFDTDSGSPELWRMRLDGSAHEKMLVLKDRNSPPAEWTMWLWFFHNKYLIFQTNTIQLIDSDDRAVINKYIVDLSLEKPELTEFRLSDDAEREASMELPYAGAGDVLYCANNGNGKVYEVNIAERTKRELCTLPFVPNLCCALEGDELYFTEGWNEGIIVSVNVATGEMTIINDAEPQTRRWYIPYNGYVFGANLSSNGELAGTEISDLSGKLIKEIPYSDYGTDIFISFILGDHVFGCDYVTGEEVDYPPTWYLDIRDIGTDDLMWRRWEP